MKAKTFFTSSLFIGIASLSISSRAIAQCISPNLTFHGPVLITGADREVGAVYKFANVGPGLDAHVKIMAIEGGATLNNIDDTTGIGYYDAFQPYVGAGPNDTSYIDWRITFKIAGTDTDTILPCLAVTGVDVDGDNAFRKEFIEAATPGSFSVDPATTLEISFDGVRSKAISQLSNIALIDTNRLDGMFQMNFTNISTLDYRNGAISVASDMMVRQTCIYFKPFFSNYTLLLPGKLLTFKATQSAKAVQLQWSAADEHSLDHYRVQKSSDGKVWKDIAKVSVQEGDYVHQYYVNDFARITGVVYYRLAFVSENGSADYSRVAKVEGQPAKNMEFQHNTIFTDHITIRSAAPGTQQYHACIYTSNGNVLMLQNTIMQAGASTFELIIPNSVRPGIYILVIKDAAGRKAYHSKLIKNNL